MKKRLPQLLGLLLYLLIMGILLDFNWTMLIKPKPFFTVVLGMIILTVSQYKKTLTQEDVLISAKWNLLFAGFLTTLMSVLSFISSSNLDKLNVTLFVEQLLPLLYSSILYLVFNLFLERPTSKENNRVDSNVVMQPMDLYNTLIADQVFREFDLTNRECHVATKLLDNISNKEIALQLYISEATVKKHIQNIYQKFQATDRNSFKELYISKAQEKANELHTY